MENKNCKQNFTLIFTSKILKKKWSSVFKKELKNSFIFFSQKRSYFKTYFFVTLRHFNNISI